MITSQIDTAPKRLDFLKGKEVSLITSQIDTAPKRKASSADLFNRLITSQIDTAPKPLEQIPPLRRGRTT